MLMTLSGLAVTQRAIAQDALRRARGSIDQRYQGLRASIHEVSKELRRC